MANKTSPALLTIEEDKRDSNYSKVLNESLKIFFKDALRVALRNPWQAYSFFRTIRWLARAARLRSTWKQQGIHVPPIIIFSITNRCNLECKGCYAQAFHRPSENELSDDRLRSITEEAKELGVSFFVLAGGEPFIRPEILSIMKDFPEIIFLVFTNGLLINDDMIMKLKAQKMWCPWLVWRVARQKQMSDGVTGLISGYKKQWKR